MRGVSQTFVGPLAEAALERMSFERPFHAWAKLAQPWTLVTDSGADPGQVALFREAGVQVQLVPVGQQASA